MLLWLMRIGNIGLVLINLSSLKPNPSIWNEEKIDMFMLVVRIGVGGGTLCT